MPPEIVTAIERKGAVALGLALKKRVDQVFPSGRMLVRIWDAHTKRTTWLVKTVEISKNKDRSSKRPAGSKETFSLREVEKTRIDNEGHFAGGAGGKSLSLGNLSPKTYQR